MVKTKYEPEPQLFPASFRAAAYKPAGERKGWRPSPMNTTGLFDDSVNSTFCNPL